MIPAKTREDLGWPELCRRLAARCATSRGEAIALALGFEEDVDAARARIEAIAEARRLRAGGAALGFGGITEVRTQLERAAVGGALEPGELIAIAECARGLARLRRRIDAAGDATPRLGAFAADLRDLRHVYEGIAAAFDDERRLRDGASDRLGALRKRAAKLAADLDQRARSFIDDPAIAPLLQDRFTTQREDRTVLPVRVDARSRIRGIVHGTSGSGQTVFIEPDAIVDLNNRLRLAHCEVADEERRILAELSGRVAAEAETLARGLAAAASLDLVAAAAALADDLDASAPVLEQGGRLALIRARHPLLVLAGRRCVPGTIELSPATVLIISGPNAGGKTVAMKTAGLAVLMARAGLHIAAADGSVTPWFTSIFSDIGDAQSIDRDLSTFSAQVLALARFLDEGDPDTLVLVDEIAVGTEPEQGAALAQAVLEALADRGIPTIVTTHYERIKALAPVDPRFANASVGFDLAEMAPTFELHAGVPGSSGALAIARRLGLAAAVADRAEALAGAGRVAVDELIATLEAERRDLRRQLDRAAEDRAGAEAARAEAERARATARERERQLRRGAHSEAVAALRSARDELQRLRAAIRRGGDRAEIAEARRRTEALSADIAANAPQSRTPAGIPAEESQLTPGTPVILPGLGGRGRVVEPPARGRVTVQVGAMRTSARVRDLLIASSAQPVTPAGSASDGGGRRVREPPDAGDRGATPPPHELVRHEDDRAPVRTADATVDVRGERVDGAVAEVDRFIDASILAARDVLFVIHGHGTGALRSAIRTHLGAHPAVRRWRAGELREGGDGVTVVWVDVD